MLGRLIYHSFIVNNSQGSPKYGMENLLPGSKELVEELRSDIFDSFNFLNNQAEPRGLRPSSY